MRTIKEYPPFSVLMSLYIKEKAEFFEQCMESMVNQTVKPSEIVIVFDLGLLSMGFGSSYVRFYSQRKAKNDNEGIEKLNGMFMGIFLCISGVCVLCGFVMICNITHIFGTGLTNIEYKTARILMALMIISLAITFPNSVFDCNLTAHEEFIFQKLLALIQSLLNPFLALPLLLLGKGSVGIVLVSTGLTIVSFIVNGVYCIKKLHMRFSFHGIQISLLKEMWIFTFFIFLSQIIDQINWSVDKFLLGRIIGTSAVAIYGVGEQINSMYLEFSTAISNVFIPEVNRLVAEENDNVKLTKLFTKVGRIQFFIYTVEILQKSYHPIDTGKGRVLFRDKNKMSSGEKLPLYFFEK